MRGAVGAQRPPGSPPCRSRSSPPNFERFCAEHLGLIGKEGLVEVFTDEAPVYKGLANHRAVKHKIGQYVDGMASTNGIESFWAGLKRGYHGTYHQMSPKHLQRYVREFAGRHNDWNQDTIEQMTRTARRMLGKRLRYADLTAG